MNTELSPRLFPLPKVSPFVYECNWEPTEAEQREGKAKECHCQYMKEKGSTFRVWPVGRPDLYVLVGTMESFKEQCEALKAINFCAAL